MLYIIIIVAINVIIIIVMVCMFLLIDQVLEKAGLMAPEEDMNKWDRL